MKEWKKGMLARSKAGHDAGKVYVIIDVDDTYVYLTDGQIRTIDNPKKKKRKHVQLIGRRYDVTAQTDVRMKRIIKQWNKEKSE